MRQHHLLARFRAGVVGIFLATLIAGGCRPAAAPVAPQPDLMPLDRLLHLVGQRIALMHDVARWKWTAGKPIQDPQRERELLQVVVERGQAKGLDPALVRAFFTAQLEAARLVQKADFDRWSGEKRGPFDGAQSLVDLRQRIDELNRELIDALVEVRPLIGEQLFQQVLLGRAKEILDGEVTAGARNAAIAPLRLERPRGPE